MSSFRLFTSIRYDPLLSDVPKHGNLYPTEWNRTAPSPWYMLDYHRDRMLKAARHFDWTSAVEKIEGPEGLQRLESFLAPFAKEAGPKAYRVKILLDQEGNLDREFSPAQQTGLENLFPSHLPTPSAVKHEGESETDSIKAAPLREPEYEVFIDTDTTAHTEFTHYKTTRRRMYDDARRRHSLALTASKEVLLVNPKDRSVMEGSFTTPFFWRNGRWVTPPVSREFQQHGGSGGNDGTTRRWALERGIAVEEMVPADSLQDGEECWISNGVRGFVFGRIKC